MGRRLPWVVGGALGGALSLVVLSIADSVVVMALGWCGVQATLNAMLAAVTATIPDQVPVGRRGRVGGILAIAQTLGVVGGTGIASATGSIAAGYLATAAVLVAADPPLLLRLPRPSRSPRELREPFDLRRVPAGRSGSRRASYPDFAWAWLTRFLVNLGNAVGLLYLLYFMQDVVGFSSDEAADRVFVLTAIYAATLVLTTVVVRHLERPQRQAQGVRDLVGHRGRRRAALLLGAGQIWPTAAVAAAVMGCGFGIYTSVDFALITQVLPGAEDRAKDLGVINIANALPQVFAPILANVILQVVERVRRRRRDRRRRVLGRLLRGVRRRVRREHPRLGVRHPDPLGALRSVSRQALARLPQPPRPIRPRGLEPASDGGARIDMARAARWPRRASSESRKSGPPRRPITTISSSSSGQRRTRLTSSSTSSRCGAVDLGPGHVLGGAAGRVQDAGVLADPGAPVGAEDRRQQVDQPVARLDRVRRSGPRRPRGRGRRCRRRRTG